MINIDSAVLVAVISGVCTLLGSGLGVIAAGKLTNYRIAQLEKKVEKHNHLVERMYSLEDRMNLMDEKVKVANHRIEDLEVFHKPK